MPLLHCYTVQSAIILSAIQRHTIHLHICAICTVTTSYLVTCLLLYIIFTSIVYSIFYFIFYFISYFILLLFLFYFISYLSQPALHKETLSNLIVHLYNDNKGHSFIHSFIHSLFSSPLRLTFRVFFLLVGFSRFLLKFFHLHANG